MTYSIDQTLIIGFCCESIIHRNKELINNPAISGEWQKILKLQNMAINKLVEVDCAKYTKNEYFIIGTVCNAVKLENEKIIDFIGNTEEKISYIILNKELENILDITDKKIEEDKVSA